MDGAYRAAEGRADTVRRRTCSVGGLGAALVDASGVGVAVPDHSRVRRRCLEQRSRRPSRFNATCGGALAIPISRTPHSRPRIHAPIRRTTIGDRYSGRRDGDPDARDDPKERDTLVDANNGTEMGLSQSIVSRIWRAFGCSLIEPRGSSSRRIRSSSTRSTTSSACIWIRRSERWCSAPMRSRRSRRWTDRRRCCR